MCSLFGLIDYGRGLTAREKNRMLSVLAQESEVRGTDATGIAYNSGGQLRTYKRPLPAHWMRFRASEDASSVIGHTRMATQGSAKRNRNNHPFVGHIVEADFALTHNGVLYNDDILRQTLELPDTKIETDSYVAVQLIEQKKTLDFASLSYMAESVRGSFTFAVLDQEESVYFVKGDNPLCLYHFPDRGLYLYTSTEEIMKHALRRLGLSAKRAQMIPLHSGDLLKIQNTGALSWSSFCDAHLSCHPGLYDRYGFGELWEVGGTKSKDSTYLDDLKSVATAFGYTGEAIDQLAAQGFTCEELEELLYCGEL